MTYKINSSVFIKFWIKFNSSSIYQTINLPMFIIKMLAGLLILFWGAFFKLLTKYKFVALPVYLILALVMVLFFPALGVEMGKIALWSLAFLIPIMVVTVIIKVVVLRIICYFVRFEYLQQRHSMAMDEENIAIDYAQEFFQSIIIWIILLVALVVS